MSTIAVPAELQARILDLARAGAAPARLVEPLLEAGYDEGAAVDAVDAIVRGFLSEHAVSHGLPAPSRVPSPVGLNDRNVLDVDGHEVAVLAQLLLPRIVVFGDVLRPDECDWLIAQAAPRLQPSKVVDEETGGDKFHAGRTSDGMSFSRGQFPELERLERRIAALLDWPYDHGEGLQVLRYGPGTQYEPHHDYFDPAQPGSAGNLRRGGQRVASLVMYLNTPRRGGATVFPDVGFECAARRGNAVFFAYDRPHPMTRTLHGGAPVVDGEKWIATKWLREGRHD